MNAHLTETIVTWHSSAATGWVALSFVLIVLGALALMPLTVGGRR